MCDHRPPLLPYRRWCALATSWSSLGLFQHGRGFFKVVDFEAEMVEAFKIFAVRADIGRAVVLQIEHRKIDVSVSQEHRPVGAAANLPEPERFFIEMRGLGRIQKARCGECGPPISFLPADAAFCVNNKSACRRLSPRRARYAALEFFHRTREERWTSHATAISIFDRRSAQRWSRAICGPAGSTRLNQNPAELSLAASASSSRKIRKIRLIPTGIRRYDLAGFGDPGAEEEQGATVSSRELRRRSRACNPHFNIARANAYDAPSTLTAMDIEGIDVAVMCSCVRQILCHDDLKPDYAAALARAYNNWAADYCKTDPQRLKFAAQVAMHDIWVCGRGGEAQCQ